MTRVSMFLLHAQCRGPQIERKICNIFSFGSGVPSRIFTLFQSFPSFWLGLQQLIRKTYNYQIGIFVRSQPNKKAMRAASLSSFVGLQPFQKSHLIAFCLSLCLLIADFGENIPKLQVQKIVMGSLWLVFHRIIYDSMYIVGNIC